MDREPTDACRQAACRLSAPPRAADRAVHLDARAAGPRTKGFCSRARSSSWPSASARRRRSADTAVFDVRPGSIKWRTPGGAADQGGKQWGMEPATATRRPRVPPRLASRVPCPARNLRSSGRWRTTVAWESLPGMARARSPAAQGLPGDRRGRARPVAIVPTTESEPGRAVPAHGIRSPARSAVRLPGTVCPSGQESTGDSRAFVLAASRATCSGAGQTGNTMKGNLIKEVRQSIVNGRNMQDVFHPA